MKRDSKFSGVLHILLHMCGADTPLTSEELAQTMRTNPVVVRRLLGGLRDTGLVRSEKGHGGGWWIACDPVATTLYDVYLAVGSPEPFALSHRVESPECLVERAVNASLDDAFNQAEALLLARLKDVSLASLAAQFQSHRAAHDVRQGACFHEL
jgi:DNA-binding IscR family transcriptional regulator